MPNDPVQEPREKLHSVYELYQKQVSAMAPRTPRKATTTIVAGRKACEGCGACKDKGAFSSRQWKKISGKCQVCIVVWYNSSSKKGIIRLRAFNLTIYSVRTYVRTLLSCCVA